jgi:hypothetical protein
MSKDSFKAFVSKKPELAEYVKDNTMTWQKFYEIYDIYGENEEIWNKYTTTRQTNKISELIKKFDPESFEKWALRNPNDYRYLMNKWSLNHDVERLSIAIDNVRRRRAENPTAQRRSDE